MSLNDAIREAYADPGVDDDILETLQLDHVSFDSPVRIIANHDKDLTLPLGGGSGNALFRACPVAVTLSGYDEDGPTTGRVQIDNVSQILQPKLQEAVKAGQSLRVVYRAYVMSDLSVPGEVRAGLVLTRVSLSATSAVGTLEPETKADRQAFPRITYGTANYPALHGLV